MMDLRLISHSDVRANLVMNTIQEVAGTAHFVPLAEFLHISPHGGICFGGPFLHGFLLGAWEGVVKGP